MQFSTAFLVAFLGSAVVAAPVAEPTVRNMAASTPQWIFQSWTRTCNSADTSCKYSYTINPQDSAPTACTYTITASSKASRASYNGVKCGVFTISSNWSGQFGDNNGFQTLATVRNRQIAYPAYSDHDITNGKPVTPDRAFNVQNI